MSLTGKKPELCNIGVFNYDLKCYINQRTVKLFNFKIINYKYFIAIFNVYIKNYINNNLGNGSNQSNISFNDIKNINIPIPTNPEQIQYCTHDLHF